MLAYTTIAQLAFCEQVGLAFITCAGFAQI
jgi:hypothetical protein